MTHPCPGHGFAALVCAFLLATDGLASERVVPGVSSATGTSVLRVAEVPSPLSLGDALRLAREHHPDVRLARASLAAARADSTYAGVYAFNPAVELLTSRGGESLGSGTDGSVEIGISQEIELWGKRGQRQAVAGARSRTATAEVEARAQAVESTVRAQFQRTLFLQQRLELLTELANLDRVVVASARARVRDGSITPLTGRLIELDFLHMESQRLRSGSEFRQSLIAMGLALGAAVPETLRLSGTVEIDSLRLSDDAVVTRAIQDRRQREVLLRNIEERHAERRLADVEGRPNVTVGAGLSRERQALRGDDFTGDPSVVGGIIGARDTDYLWRAGISVPIPLWQQNQGPRARAAAEVRLAEVEYDGLLARIQLEALAAARRFRDATALHRIYLERSVRLREDLALMRDAYADGRISLDSYLTEKGRLVDTLIDGLEAADAYWETRAALETAAGQDLGRLNQRGSE